MSKADAGSVSYSAALESAAALDTAADHSPFAQRVWRGGDPPPLLSSMA